MKEDRIRAGGVGPEARAVGARAEGSEPPVLEINAVCGHRDQNSRKADVRKLRFVRRHAAQQRTYTDLQRQVAQLHEEGRGEEAEGLKLHRSFWCGHKRRNAGDYISVRYNGEMKKAHYSGTMYCGAGWRCPVCANMIRGYRAQEVAQAVENWQGRGGGLYMVTVTVRHHLGDDLGVLLDVLSNSWRGVVSARSWKKAKKQHGIVGYVRSLEITYSDNNGFHPHYHFLFFSEDKATEEGAQELERLIFEHWVRYVEKNGGKTPNEAHGVRVDAVDDRGRVAAMYVSKVADDGNVSLELARADLKESDEVGSITPFQLLDVDTPKARKLWDVYVKATKGKWSVYFSRGLRDLVGLGADKTDDDIIEEMRSVGDLSAEVEADVYENQVATRPESLSAFLGHIERRDLAAAAELFGCVVEYERRLDLVTGEVVERCPVFKRKPPG